LDSLSRMFAGLLLAYYDLNGRLVYAGRVAAGIDYAELGRLWRRLQPLATSQMQLDKAPPRTNWFGSPLVPSVCIGYVPSLWSRSNI
jgi:ATP-dependent DNA ligase